MKLIQVCEILKCSKESLLHKFKAVFGKGYENMTFDYMRNKLKETYPKKEFNTPMDIFIFVNNYEKQ